MEKYIENVVVLHLQSCAPTRQARWSMNSSNLNTMYRYQKLGSNSRLENTENWARLRVKVHFFRITALLLVPGGLPYIGARANSIRIYALGDLGCKLRLFTK